MNPTGLPELFKPTRDQNKRQKCEKNVVLKSLKKIKKLKFQFFTNLPLKQVPGGFKQLRETRRIHLHHFWYLYIPGISSYVHFCELKQVDPL